MSQTVQDSGTPKVAVGSPINKNPIAGLGKGGTGQRRLNRISRLRGIALFHVLVAFLPWTKLQAAEFHPTS